MISSRKAISRVLITQSEYLIFRQPFDTCVSFASLSLPVLSTEVEVHASV